MFNILFFVISLFFAVAPIVICVRLRDIVKMHRQGIIEELAGFFEKPGETDGIVHSFEFVKVKYHLSGPIFEAARDFRPIEWLVPSFFLVVLLFGMNCFSLLIIGVALKPDEKFVALMADPLNLVKIIDGNQPWAWSFLAAYCGAYVFLIRALLQAINNFDLTPGSFFGAFVNLFLGITMPQIAYFGLSFLWPKALNNDLLTEAATGSAIVLSFIAGFSPESILRETFRRTNVGSFKRENEAIYYNFTSIPIEIIDGIDSVVRDRFRDFHISTVQNLATANPILLYVETPYGIYQLIDWVAQAQLCATVGPTALVQLWKLGVRTIFDLEILARCKSNDAIISEVGKSIMPASTGGSSFSVDDIRSDIMMRLDQRHVQRLRQIINCINERLGEKSRCLYYGADERADRFGRDEAETAESPR